jgi:hypothetical protein
LIAAERAISPVRYQAAMNVKGRGKDAAARWIAKRTGTEAEPSEDRPKKGRKVKTRPYGPFAQN